MAICARVINLKTSHHIESNRSVLLAIQITMNENRTKYMHPLIGKTKTNPQKIDEDLKRKCILRSRN